MAAPDADLRIEPVISDEAIATWAEVHNRAAPCRPEGVDQLRHHFALAPDWRAVVAWRGDCPVGVGHVEVQHWVPGSRHADAWIVVPNEERRNGIGTALAHDASRWAGERGLSGLDLWVDESEPDAPGFWARRGYREVGRERISQVDLSGPAPPDPPVPDGVELVTLAGRDDLVAGMYRVATEGFADIPGPDRYDVGDFEHWCRGELRRPGLIEDGSVVAVADGEVVGFAVLVQFEARPHVAEHEMTAVARAWRGRGIARAIKRRQNTLARGMGLAALESSNEARNAPILAVNAHLGYVPVTDLVQLRGPLC